MSRGRGRGASKGIISNLEALGIKSRDSIPPPLLHPPPLFPQLERKPLELKNDETSRYLLCVKQELQNQMRQSPFYLKPIVHKANNEIIKYSDRYKTSSSNDLTELLNSIPNWKTYMPKELHFIKRKTVSKLTPIIQIPETERHSSNHRGPVPQVEIGERLKQLEEKEGVIIESEDDDGGVRTEDEYDEEIEEEQGDYQQSYFDPGDEFSIDAEDDALEDGPSY